MSKRGMLFTVTTFIILWALFMLNLSYINRNSELQKIVVDSAYGNKIMFVEDDVLDGVYWDTINLNLSYVTRNSENFTVMFNGLVLSEDSNHWTPLQQYEDYIEGKYSNWSNVVIKLENFDPIFNINPYSNQLVINNSQLSLTTGQPLQINSFFVEIEVNESYVNQSTNSSPTDTGIVPIIVRVYDESSNHMLSDEIAYLNPGIVNQGFFVDFDDGSMINVEFGNFLGQDGSLLITTSKLSAEIIKLKLVYNISSEPIEVTSGQLLINITDDPIVKQSQITLYKE